ncbi:uncharacterized protein FIBRA_09287 [Fibroporia radiculosa]|uniref:Uncharacterized protein n=1 Tax=Fibroporia radiculosa TaxID=599839 RepID=J7SCW5_9APHY|nr:uncharacterized protein FIBRA_09287 [Fibroporia radiculosa]CCM06973.1 predicted protein [Fibroporia radiculosa]
MSLFKFIFTIIVVAAFAMNAEAEPCFVTSDDAEPTDVHDHSVRQFAYNTNAYVSYSMMMTYRLIPD